MTIDQEIVLAPLRVAVKEQGDLVRKLKADGAAELDVKKAVAELKLRKKTLEERELQLAPAANAFDRAKLEDLLTRRFFYDQSFAIYGGITGLYDFGPRGCELKNNILKAWRVFFVEKEKMQEVECSILTPEPILKSSGHVDRFADLMVKDLKNGECFRLDHLLKNFLEKLGRSDATQKQRTDDLVTRLDGMSKADMQSVLREFGIKSPLTGNELSEPVEFNLMFSTQIGPTGLVKAFLRPETAQGIFVNFKRLLENSPDRRLPFAAAQIGKAFRNEISPRSGLLRVREFTMAEIEHFCDPSDKSHPSFAKVRDVRMTLYSACNQMDGKSAESHTIGEAVASGLVANETLGYFIARIQLFLERIGVLADRLRFRQHMDNEMAHYACDCWDAELLTSYGWVECVGCADRSAYDLGQHAKATGVKLVAQKTLAAPKRVEVTEALPNKAKLGKTFGKHTKTICERLAELGLDELTQLRTTVEAGQTFRLADEFELTGELVSVKTTTSTVHVEEIVPNVIEPSFGIGRILYALLEHRFAMRDGDEQRCYLSLPPLVAPIKVTLLPLSDQPQFRPILDQISDALDDAEISHSVDASSGSIGRRYARADEIAIPFGITIDFDTLKSEPATVTLRERDSMQQLRIPVADVADVVSRLSGGRTSWTAESAKYPRFEQQESKD